MTKIMNNLTTMQKFFNRFKRKKKVKEVAPERTEAFAEDCENWLGGEAASYIFLEESEKKKKQKVRKR